MIKIVRSQPRFDGRSTFATWAYRVATNASLDELRRRKRRPALHAVGDDAVTEIADEEASRRLGRIDDQLAIDDALCTVSDDFRVAVVLRDVVDLDYQEIATVLDLPIGTVKSRIARARAQLADQLRLEDLPPLPPTPDPSELHAVDDAHLDDPGNPDGVSERRKEADD